MTRKKIDKYFKGSTIFAFFNDLSSPPASSAFLKRPSLYLKDVELSKAKGLKGFQHYSLEIHPF